MKKFPWLFIVLGGSFITTKSLEFSEGLDQEFELELPGLPGDDA